MIPYVINYERIARAIAYYKAKGYQYIETPWMASQQALELIHYYRSVVFSPTTIVRDALGFFKEETSYSKNELNTISTTEGVDIFLGSLEIGSYGAREIPRLGHSWIYGTGLAEPRFESALRK